MTETKKEAPAVPALATIEDVLAHAYAIELDAVARYTELAGQMEVHNNPELAVVFGKLAKIEQIHADEIAERAKGLDLPKLSPWEYQWQGLESPEAVDAGQAHYLMTPYQALQLSLVGETAARDFYEVLAGSATDPQVKTLAEEFAEEEREHVRLIEEWMAKYPAPEEDWDEDLDPPVYQE